MSANPEEMEQEFTGKVNRLNAAIDAYEAVAIGSDNDNGELTRQRALAIDAYRGKNIDPAPEGRSQVTDRTVFETTQWILPSLTRIFASGDNVVEFDPFGPEDEEASEQESEYLNYLVTRKNNWFLTCLTWFQDALNTKNAYCMAFIEEKLETEVETYEGQSQEQVALLLQDDVEVVGQQEYIDEDIEPEPIVDELGQVVGVQPAIRFDVQLRRTTPRERLAFRVLAPEHCKVDENCTDFTLEDCNYFEFWDEVTISDLRAMGYNVPDDISDDDRKEADTEEDTARDEELNTDFFRDDNPPDKSLRRVRTRWIWVRYDFDEDGIAELLHVVRVGNTVFEMDSVSTIPVASLVPFLNTHRHMGNSVTDLVFDIQQIKTDILRQGLDNLRQTQNPREFFSKKVNLDSLLLSRPGAKIEVDTESPDVAGHVFTSQLPFVFPQAQEGLRHMDTVVESRVGVNRIFQGIDESNLNDHNRIGQLSTMAAQRVEQIARIFGNGVQRLFQIAHELVIKSGHKAESIKLRGEWVEFDPKQWKTGRDMRVVAPYAAGNKDSLLQRLFMIADIHEKSLASGLPIVQQDDAYQLALEIAKASDVSGDKFFTDPATLPPPEPEPDYTAAALEVEAQKAQTQELDSQRDAEIDKYKADLQAEVDKYKADLQAQVQIAIAASKNEGAIDLERARANLKELPIDTGEGRMSASDAFQATQASNQAIEALVKALQDAMSELRADMEADQEVIREDDRIVGKRNTRTGKVTMLRGV